MESSPVLATALVILYIVVIGLFFWFLFMPIQLLMIVAAFLAVAFQFSKAVADVFELEWSGTRGLRLACVLYALTGLSLELAGFTFKLLNEAGASFLFFIGKESLRWLAQTDQLLKFLPDHYIAMLLTDILGGQGFSLKPAGFLLLLILVGALDYLLLIPIVAAGRILYSRHTSISAGSQPAYRSYFLRRVFIDLKDLIKASWNRTVELVAAVARFGADCFGETALFSWPIGVAIFTGMVFPTIIAVVNTLVILLIQILVTLIVIFISMILTAVLVALERIGMFIRGIHMVCPNANCYKKISLPTYRCPGCHREHDHLLPGVFGLVGRRCLCGKLLPTLFLFGRNRLPAFCPHCGVSLSQEIGVTQNVHVPILGGPAVGKTSFLVAAYVAIRDFMKVRQGSVSLPDSALKRRFESFIDSYQSGVTVNKTPAEPPDALLMKVHKKVDLDLTDALLYLYDPGGEVLEADDPLRLHSYFRDLDGVILLIDPFSLTSIRDSYHASVTEFESELSPSYADPEQIASRFINVLQTFKRKGRKARLSVPLAVVLTKWDAFDLQTVAPIGAVPDETSQEIRRWITEKAFAGNLVRTLESYFKEVRYFACSALGTMPSGSSISFSPKGVVEPILWVTHRKNVF